jgi:hypothetical protein
MGYSDAPKTLAELEQIQSDVLTCAQISKVLRLNPATIHAQAITQRSALGFPVVVAGNRVIIPKEPFLKFMRGE